MKEQAKTLVKAGTYLLLTNGEYSDYAVQNLVKATQDFDIKALEIEYLSLPDRKDRNLFGGRFADVNSFSNWLLNIKKVVEEVPHCEWYLGPYGELEGKLT